MTIIAYQSILFLELSPGALLQLWGTLLSPKIPRTSGHPGNSICFFPVLITVSEFLIFLFLFFPRKGEWEIKFLRLFMSENVFILPFFLDSLEITFPQNLRDVRYHFLSFNVTAKKTDGILILWSSQVTWFFSLEGSRIFSLVQHFHNLWSTSMSSFSFMRILCGSFYSENSFPSFMRKHLPQFPFFVFISPSKTFVTWVLDYLVWTYNFLTFSLLYSISYFCVLSFLGDVCHSIFENLILCVCWLSYFPPTINKINWQKTKWERVLKNDIIYKDIITMVYK